MITAVLLCFVLASCGTTDDGRNMLTTDPDDVPTESFYNNETDGDITLPTEGGTFMESLSEVVSEGMSDSSFLDPQNGIVSDTQEAMD